MGEQLKEPDIESGLKKTQGVHVFSFKYLERASGEKDWEN